MRFVALDKEYEVNTKNLGKVKIPENTLEVPVLESLDECVQFAGGEPQLIEVVNDAIRGTAKNGAVAIVRNAPEKSVLEDILTKAARYARDFNFSTVRTSKKAVLEGVDKIRTLSEQGGLESMSKEEILALLSSNLGIATAAR